MRQSYEGWAAISGVIVAAEAKSLQADQIRQACYPFPADIILCNLQGLETRKWSRHSQGSRVPTITPAYVRSRLPIASSMRLRRMHILSNPFGPTFVFSKSVSQIPMLSLMSAGSSDRYSTPSSVIWFWAEWASPYRCQAKPESVSCWCTERPYRWGYYQLH